MQYLFVAYVEDNQGRSPTSRKWYNIQSNVHLCQFLIYTNMDIQPAASDAPAAPAALIQQPLVLHLYVYMTRGLT